MSMKKEKWLEILGKEWVRTWDRVLLHNENGSFWAYKSSCGIYVDEDLLTQMENEFKKCKMCKSWISGCCRKRKPVNVRFLITRFLETKENEYCDEWSPKDK
ncbi:hypothetical protein LCGC14_2197450 [marine sediment metagenome]|uniref:Uncharacterized protein n=1 Tax=marine sediment metagenome TaxID=412755 RepID=A0A0F9E4U3_9ZZZZ